MLLENKPECAISSGCASVYCTLGLACRRPFLGLRPTQFYTSDQPPTPPNHLKILYIEIGGTVEAHQLKSNFSLDNGHYGRLRVWRDDRTCISQTMVLPDTWVRLMHVSDLFIDSQWDNPISTWESKHPPSCDPLYKLRITRKVWWLF